MGTASVALAMSDSLTAWPLLVLDAGVFEARCRRCGWTSPGQLALEATLAAFEGHVCGEPSS
jgi:hypothetical protein